MTWDITTPADTESVRQGASRIRELKIDLAAAMAAEFVFPGSDAANPKLYYAPPRGSTGSRPASSASTPGRLYVNSDTNSIQRDRGDGANWDDVTPTLPTGSITMWGGSGAPAGWLLCDGSAVSRVTYASLFGIIGSKHGQGDGFTTFNLPDCRGRFVRGVDHGQARDPNAASRTAGAVGGNTGDAVGSVQGQATAINGLALHDPQHQHQERVYTSGAGASKAVGSVSATGGGTEAGADFPSAGTSLASTGITATGDAETRPINIGLDYIIKY